VVGTSDGGLHRVLLLEKRVAATLIALQDQLHKDYLKFSKVFIKGETRQSARMVYLDLVHKFLTLPD
jgi:hypothetical protein